MNISVAGVAEKNGRVLVALRKPGTSIGVKWEFPGGKLESGETPEEALHREYREELDVSISVHKQLCEGTFSNGSKSYKLLAYSIDLKETAFRLPEHQKAEWVKISDLRTIKFPDSDKIIVDYLLSR